MSGTNSSNYDGCVSFTACYWREELDAHRDFLNRFIELSLPIHNGERILTLRDMRIRAYITQGTSEPVDHLFDIRKARWIALFFSEECKQMQRQDFNEVRFRNLIRRISQQEERIMQYTENLIECTKKVDENYIEFKSDKTERFRRCGTRYGDSI